MGSLVFGFYLHRVVVAVAALWGVCIKWHQILVVGRGYIIAIPRWTNHSVSVMMGCLHWSCHVGWEVVVR